MRINPPTAGDRAPPSDRNHPPARDRRHSFGAGSSVRRERPRLRPSRSAVLVVQGLRYVPKIPDQVRTASPEAARTAPRIRIRPAPAPALMPSCTLIAYENPKGIRSDLEILTSSIARLGFLVRTQITPPHRSTVFDEIATIETARKLTGGPLRAIKALQAVARWRSPERPAVKIFLERLPLPDLLDSSYKIFVPNPEWLIPEDEWKLELMDVIACKSRDAANTFARRDLPVYYLGFTSEDRFSGEATPDRREYLHIASGGRQKGTAEIIDAWHHHPEWPHLTILAGISPIAADAAHNLTLIKDWCSDGELRGHMQRCGVHVCCSNSEGFGHTIVEGMSCGALVITTDFPPMNELVDESRGVLVRTRSATPMRRGRFAQLDPADIERAVDLTISLGESDYRSRCLTARAWFLRERDAFEQRLGELLRSIHAPRRDPAQR